MTTAEKILTTPAEDLLDQLTDEQRAAVTSPKDGSVLVIAGAGTGKTTTMCARLIYLLTRENINPKRICCAAYTKQSARVLQARAEGLLGKKIGTSYIGTIHSLCFHLLKKEGVKVGIKPDFTIVTREEQLQILREFCPTSSELPSNSHKKLLDCITKIKCESDWEKMLHDMPSLFQTVWEEYHVILRKENYLDFDDLIFRSLPIAHTANYSYLLVDEFQDLNDLQVRFCGEVLGDDGHLFAVGDDDQRIYSFRGAHYSFEGKHSKKSKRFTLTKNYRSTASILNLANAIIDDNFYRHRKDLSPARSDEEKETPICLFLGADADHEREFVANSIRKLNGSGIPFREIAVISRTQQPLVFLEAALSVSGIPFRSSALFGFTNRKDYRALFGFLRLLTGKYDVLAWKMALLATPGVGSRTVEKIISQVKDSSDIYDVCAKDPRACALTNTIALLSDKLKGEDDAFIDVLKVGMKLFLNDPLSDSAEVFTQTAKHFLKRNEGLSPMELLDEFSAHVHLSASNDISDDAVSLLTVHAAKGTEFDAVYILQSEDGSFPHFLNHNIEEERRLFFVACTRARKFLALTMVKNRLVVSEKRMHKMNPSRFLSKPLKEKLIRRYLLESIR